MSSVDIQVLVGFLDMSLTVQFACVFKSVSFAHSGIEEDDFFVTFFVCELDRGVQGVGLCHEVSKLLCCALPYDEYM